MKFKVFYKPTFHIIVEDVFTNEENQKILEEAISLEDKFVNAMVGAEESFINNELRTNLSVYYDVIYNGRRNESPLLKKIDELTLNTDLIGLMSSSIHPMTSYTYTNHHESQVSRYGEGEHYDWHIDSRNSQERLVTFVYWFNTEPKKYSGGELQLSNAPSVGGKIIECDDNEIKTIIPENNTMIIFGSHKSHRVLPTKSPKTFKDGRFSVNVWVGIQ